jgi:hypothetical protein
LTFDKPAATVEALQSTYMANYKNPYKGKDKTPSGVMPEDMAIRHNLVGAPYCGASDASYRKTYRHNRKVKKMFEQVKTYRQNVHGVNEPRLAQTLRDAVHFLIEPMARSAGPSNYSSVPSADTDDTLAAVSKPLKV